MGLHAGLSEDPAQLTGHSRPAEVAAAPTAGLHSEEARNVLLHEVVMS